MPHRVVPGVRRATRDALFGIDIPAGERGGYLHDDERGSAA